MGLEMPGVAGQQGAYRIVDLRCYGGESAWLQQFLPMRNKALLLASGGGANSDQG